MAPSIEDIAISVAHYKCFEEKTLLLNEIRRANLIVGKNNSGKSAILDVLEKLFSGDDTMTTYWKRQNAPDPAPTVYIQLPLKSAELIRHLAPHGQHGVALKYPDIEAIDGRFLELQLEMESNPSAISSEEEKALNEYVNLINVPIQDLKTLQGRFRVVRIAADRDVKPEKQGDDIHIRPSGAGTTNAVRAFLHDSRRDSQLIEKAVLSDLNKIYTPETQFEKIVAQYIEKSDGPWEIYLKELGKPEIPLSDCGSGLKTILLCLLRVHLRKHIDKGSLSKKKPIYAFEEPENNLHPSVLRRLATVLVERAGEEDGYLFFTTHSSVLIDVFLKNRDASIFHISTGHDAEDSKLGPRVNRTSNLLAHASIVEDLGNRGSDLLQSNGIIWVEGPTDAVYIERWIDIVSNGSISRGLAYQFAFYGGKLLSHLMVGESSENALVDIFRINRHSIVVIDSDKDSDGDSINSTKTRIKTEIEQIGAICWITSGREVENYIATRSLEAVLDRTNLPQLGQYEKIGEFLNREDPIWGNRFQRKMTLAESIVEHIKEEDMKDTLDLWEMSERCASAIRDWNR